MKRGEVMRKERETENIIAFPHLKERLVEKATMLMKEKDYREALPLLQQVHELDPEHHEGALGLVICSFELGDIKTAKHHSKRMLQEGIGDYYQVLQIHLMILVQSGDYEEGATLLQAVFDEQQVPFEHASHLHNLLQFCQTRVEELPDMPEPVDEHDQDEELRLMLENGNVNQQLDVVQALYQVDVNKHLQLFEKMLKEESVHPIVKTMLFKLLAEQQIDANIEVCKFTYKATFNPSKMDMSELDAFSAHVQSRLEEQLESNDPTLLSFALEIWQRYLFLLFPFYPQKGEQNVWVAAVHYAALEMQGQEDEMENVASQYNLRLSALQQVIDDIKKIEEISSIEM